MLSEGLGQQKGKKHGTKNKKRPNKLHYLVFQSGKESWLFCHASFSHACIAVAATSLYHSQPWSKSCCLHKTKHIPSTLLARHFLNLSSLSWTKEDGTVKEMRKHTSSSSLRPLITIGHVLEECCLVPLGLALSLSLSRGHGSSFALWISIAQRGLWWFGILGHFASWWHEDTQGEIGALWERTRAIISFDNWLVAEDWLPDVL